MTHTKQVFVSVRAWGKLRLSRFQRAIKGYANLDPGGPRWISAHCRAPLPQHLMVTPRLPDWLRLRLLAAGAEGRAARRSQGPQHREAKGSKTQRREGPGSKSSNADTPSQAATKGAGSKRPFKPSAQLGQLGRKTTGAAWLKWGAGPRSFALGFDVLRQGEGLHLLGAGVALRLPSSPPPPTAARTGVSQRKVIRTLAFSEI